MRSNLKVVCLILILEAFCILAGGTNNILLGIAAGLFGTFTIIEIQEEIARARNH